MEFEIDFLQVGQGNGDAICIRYSAGGLGYRTHVVDGGFLSTGDELVRHINIYHSQPRRIENVVLTHGDNDHAAGLIRVLESFEVGTLWMNRPWLYAADLIGYFHGRYTVDGLTKKIRSNHRYLVDLEKLALERGIPVREAFMGTQIGPFIVLAPSKQRYLALVPDFDKTPTNYVGGGALGSASGAVEKQERRYWETWNSEALSEQPDLTSASNESSVVQLGIFGNEAVLLTADAGPEALIEARLFAESIGFSMRLSFFQVPHHGSRRNVTPTVLNRWLGFPKAAHEPRQGYAFCSIGSDKTAYPRKRVSNACLRRGYPVISNARGYARYYVGMSMRSGEYPITPIPFVYEFDE